MVRVTSKKFGRSLAEVRRQARRQPVEIRDHGRSGLVLMSADHYDLLKAAAKRTHRTADASRAVITLVERAEMASEHGALDDLMT